MHKIFSRGAMAAAFTAALVVTKEAKANDGDPCDALTGDADNAIPKIYIESGDTQEFMLKRLGKQLLKSANKVRIIYRNRPTCNLAADLYNKATMVTVTDGTTPRPVTYIPDGDAFNPETTPSPKCTVPATGGVTIALGIGATYLTSCATLPAKPADIEVIEGPNQAYGFVKNKQATQEVAITAEESYLAFGFPDEKGDAKPWTVQNLRFRRGPTASTTLTMSAAMHVTPAQLQAIVPPTKDSSQEIINSVVAATATANAAIGILGMDLYDGNRANLSVYAFKTWGQKYAYFPDSTSESFDKKNVRDGHYVPWSSTEYISQVGVAPGTFADANAQRIFELVTGKRVGDDLDGLVQAIHSGLVPKCAMKVQRAGDGTDLSLYSDPTPCHCFFDKNVTQGSTTCTACTGTDNTPCGSGVCRHNFCEAK